MPVQFKRLISVVDDDEGVRTSLRDLLMSSGYEVQVYDCADAFLKDPMHLHCDCIVSDIQMPRMSGLEMTGKLVNQGVAIPVILISAFATEAIRRQADRLSVYRLIEKPFDPVELLAVIAAGIAGGR